MPKEIQITISGGREAIVAELDRMKNEIANGSTSLYVDGNGDGEDKVAITFDADEMLAKDLAEDGGGPLIAESKRVSA